ncbi:hypothetical protein KW795_00635 [Candidatus Microgenomates bacterium]|nr:hypothetical protein [Candidatus Microgenomates bacterium]
MYEKGPIVDQMTLFLDNFESIKQQKMTQLLQSAVIDGSLKIVFSEDGEPSYFVTGLAKSDLTISLTAQFNRICNSKPAAERQLKQDKKYNWLIVCHGECKESVPLNYSTLSGN